MIPHSDLCPDSLIGTAVIVEMDRWSVSPVMSVVRVLSGRSEPTVGAEDGLFNGLESLIDVSHCHHNH
jgi:hypothetical protein